MGMLKMDKICAGYGDLKVLFDVSLEINEGEVVALVGPTARERRRYCAPYPVKSFQPRAASIGWGRS